MHDIDICLFEQVSTRLETENRQGLRLTTPRGNAPLRAGLVGGLSQMMVYVCARVYWCEWRGLRGASGTLSW